MGIFEAIKKGFGLTSKLKGLIVLFFVFNVVIGLIGLPLTNQQTMANPMIIVLSIAISIVFFLIFIFLQGGALSIVKDQLTKGSYDMADFSKNGKKFYGRIFLLLLLYVLIAIGVVLCVGAVSAGVLLLGDNIITRVIVAVIVSVVALLIMTLLIYPIYVIIVEDVGAIASFNKGIAISKANFGKTIGLFMSVLIISLVISLIIGFVVGLVTAPFGTTIIAQIIIAIVNAVVQAFIPIVMMVAFMSFYLSLSGKSESATVEQEDVEKEEVVSDVDDESEETNNE